MTDSDIIVDQWQFCHMKQVGLIKFSDYHCLENPQNKTKVVGYSHSLKSLDSTYAYKTFYNNRCYHNYGVMNLIYNLNVICIALAKAFFCFKINQKNWTLQDLKDLENFTEVGEGRREWEGGN